MLRAFQWFQTFHQSLTSRCLELDLACGLLGTLSALKSGANLMKNFQSGVVTLL